MDARLLTSLSYAPGPLRTAAIVAWFQGLFSPGQTPPILVGGAAVELYSGGAYTTGDLDFVGSIPPGVVRRLRAAGFRKEGHHWIHEEARIYLELPGWTLGPGELAARIRVGKFSVLAISPEDILVDRLASWQFWSSSIDGINAYLLWRGQGPRLNRRRLAKLAKKNGVEASLRNLISFVRRTKGRPATNKELEKWAIRKL